MTIIYRYVHGEEHQRGPFIPILARTREGHFLKVSALVDSGADHTVVPKRIATLLGLTQGNEIKTTGIGGSAKVKTSTFQFLLKGNREKYTFTVQSLVIQEENNMPLLLGRDGFFNHFHITFRHNEEKIMLKKVQTSF